MHICQKYAFSLGKITIFEGLLLLRTWKLIEIWCKLSIELQSKIYVNSGVISELKRAQQWSNFDQKSIKNWWKIINNYKLLMENLEKCLLGAIFAAKFTQNGLRWANKSKFMLFSTDFGPKPAPEASKTWPSGGNGKRILWTAICELAALDVRLLAGVSQRVCELINMNQSCWDF